LPQSAYQRAHDDLLDVYARASAVLGNAAAQRACTREAFLIVFWSVVDRVRNAFESRPAQRHTRRPSMLGDLAQDVRFGVRALLRRPGFAMIATVVLGLGIGANVAIFTLADRLFLRAPPAIVDPQSLVRVFRSWGVPGVGGSLSYPDYLEYRDGATKLSGLAAFAGPLAATARMGAAPEPVQVQPVTADYFSVLGVRPATGRFFLTEENRTPDTHPVAVVSWRFWQDRLRGDAAAIGSELLLNGHSFTIVGVAPREFQGLTPGQPVPQVYIPILMRNAIQPVTGTAWRERVPNERETWLSAVGRLVPGAAHEAVETELAAIKARIVAAYDEDESETVLVTREFRWLPSTRTSLASLTRILLVSVGLLLAIATANVAILLLARASTRDREMGIRSAIGAGRGRIARLMLAESTLLGIAGCALGLLISVFAARVAAALLPITLAAPALPDARVLLFAAGISLITALLVGVAPAWRASRTDVVRMIQGRDRRAGGSRTRDALVVLQVALSLVLVAGATLFARSLLAARAVDVGFDARGVLLVRVNLRNHGYDAARGRAFLQNAVDRLSALPGVAIATTTGQAPFRGEWSTTLEPWPGVTFAGGRPDLSVGLNVVGPGYFDAMGIPLVRGRGFSPADREGGSPVVIVNETFARIVFGETDALGQTVPLRDGQPPLTIVGIARDATYYELNEEPWTQAYAPVMQLYQPGQRFLIKTSADPMTLVKPVQDALHAIDPDIAFASVETLESVHAEQLARYRASAQLVGLSGIIALVLAGAGLYGVMAYRVAQRRREIGLRVALGASRGTLARDIVGRGLRLTVIGIALGLAGSLLLGRFVESMLFGVQSRDPVAFIAAPLVLLVAGVAALLVPARRAMRVDPMTAMRTE
jgi:predicted permease